MMVTMVFGAKGGATDYEERKVRMVAMAFRGLRV